MLRTNGDPPHGVGPAGFFWLQNPGFTVDFVQRVPELVEGIQNKQELAVKLLQRTLNKQDNNTHSSQFTRQLISETIEAVQFPVLLVEMKL